MAKPPNQDLINRLMAELEEQREVIERAKDARQIMRELNRMIAVLGGEPPERVPLRHVPRGEGTEPVVEPDERGVYVCPECGVEMNRPQGLGIHRKMKHGVEGKYAGEKRGR